MNQSNCTINQWYTLNHVIIGCVKDSTEGMRDGDEIQVGPILACENIDGDNFIDGTIVQTPDGLFTLGVRRCH